eukprot:symbB.v1.2.021933.t1/scaffold1877.1/size97417/9
MAKARNLPDMAQRKSAFLVKSGPMKADVDGIAEQINCIIEAELAKRIADLERREREVQVREEAVRKREAAADTPTPSRAASSVEKKSATETATPLLFQAPKDFHQAKSSEVSSQPGRGEGERPGISLFQEPERPEPETAAGSASQLKDRFEQKASSSESATRPYRHSAPAEKSQRGRAEFSQVSAGTAGEIKDM